MASTYGDRLTGEGQPSSNCCGPPGRAVFRPAAAGKADSGTGSHAPTGLHSVEQAQVPGGLFMMGDAHGDGVRPDGERPVHAVEVSPFTIDTTSVTNAVFSRFAEATGYQTEAERFGYSAVFHLGVKAESRDVLGRSPLTPWWLAVRGASWRHPEGPRSDIGDRADHPVVHVSWNDAQAYCEWTGRRLPTEAEWECASRGGLEGARYPWGDDLQSVDGSWQCNIWQGSFPSHNTREDGYLTTAPVRTYRPNGYGLWQTVGNVWEWCTDVFSPRAYDEALARGTPARNPHGPEAGDSRVLRGGSYLCHDSYCNRYRNSARSQNTPDSSMGNAGFRTCGFRVSRSLKSKITPLAG
jgi:formylglycine-generating enzyme